MATHMDAWLLQLQNLSERCVVSTDVRAEPELDIGVSGQEKDEGSQYQASCFRSMKWSPDGKCLLATDYGRKLHTFILDPNTFYAITSLSLRPYSSISAASPFHDFVPYPYFDLHEPSSTLVLNSVGDEPIALTNVVYPHSEGSVIDSSAKVGRYHLFNSLREQYIRAHSLVFTSDGSHFLAGSENLISLFDVNRSGQGPVREFATIPSRKMASGPKGFKGIVSAMQISQNKTLAIGTWSRYVALYSNEGSGHEITKFKVDYDNNRHYKHMSECGGLGVSQVLWSPCNKYLYIAEKKSDVALIYDVRMFRQCLSWIKGRNATTNQKMEISIYPSYDGHEIWAGGVDGVIRVWKNPWQKMDGVEPDFQWKAHDGPVASTVVHPSGMFVAACSGELEVISQRLKDSSDKASSSDSESSSDSDEDSSSDSESDPESASPGKEGESISESSDSESESDSDSDSESNMSGVEADKKATTDSRNIPNGDGTRSGNAGNAPGSSSARYHSHNAPAGQLILERGCLKVWAFPPPPPE